MQARCKVQGRFRRFRVLLSQIRFKVPEVSQARCKVQGRFQRFRGGLVQARCKVQGRFRRVQGKARERWFKEGSRGSRQVPEVSGWSGKPGVRFKEGSRGFGVVWCSQV